MSIDIRLSPVKTVTTSDIYAFKKQHGDNDKRSIQYSFGANIFGQFILASTEIGMCFIGYCDNNHDGIAQLNQHFSVAKFTISLLPLNHTNCHHLSAIEAMEFLAGTPLVAKDKTAVPNVSIHLIGTQFQLSVWQALLTLTYGERSTYGDIASLLGNNKAVRAVGTAIGKNPIASLIPCHRVIQKSGSLGGYRWGVARKELMLTNETLTLNKVANI